MNFQEFKEKCQNIKKEKITKSSLMYRWQRKISIIISWCLVNIFPKIRANHVSIANILLVLLTFLSSYFLSFYNSFAIILIQMLLLNFSAVMDKIDGEIARFQNFYTQKGIYYDLIYHFLYPLTLYSVLGFYFYNISGNISLLIISLISGTLASVYVIARKTKHHIKYKILLEGNQDAIKDYVLKKELKKIKRPLLPFRILNYFIFLIYDWTWFLFLVLIIFSNFYLVYTSCFYFLFLLISVLFILDKILIVYPENLLYSREDIK